MCPANLKWQALRARRAAKEAAEAMQVGLDP